MLFAATDDGAVRSYKHPLSGEFQEFQCHAGRIERAVLSVDDMFLFTVSADGALAIWDVRDRDRGAKAPKELLFAEEILVTKVDLEEHAAQAADLEARVAELTQQIDYQLRLKEMTHLERIKDLTDKYTAEFEAEKSRYEVLAKERSEIEIEYEERFAAQDARHAQAAQGTETAYSAKLMAEMERYTALSRQMEEVNARWDEQTMLLVEGHERVIQEVTEEYETRIQEDQAMIERLGEEKDELQKEFEETRRQIEEDADREIEDLKERYETKLAQEREAGLRLKGENGIYRKKFAAQQKDLEDHKQEIKTQFEECLNLQHQIANRDKDIQGLKKEIEERDQTIGDKEKRIYDLKKKNQELEKFKFVLDYKIKELKKQIEPRELEINDMKDQIREMDQELERYHKNNANLELTIGDLKLKIDGLQRDANIQRQKLHDGESALKRLKTDLHEAVQHIQEPQVLKEKVKALYHRHVSTAVQSQGVEADVQREYARQREYLERNLDSMKRKLAKDQSLHKTENRRIMNENQTLIKEINDLRRELRLIKQQQSDAKSGLARLQQRGKGGRAGAGGAGGTGDPRELEWQRVEISRLRERLARYEDDMSSRPKSRERLPPMDGFSEHTTPTPSNPTPTPME
jgi:chromosome segregation ATPase